LEANSHCTSPVTVALPAIARLEFSRFQQSAWRVQFGADRTLPFVFSGPRLGAPPAVNPPALFFFFPKSATHVVMPPDIEHA